MAKYTFHSFVLAVKRMLYGTHGEPYVIDGFTLRYTPGTRPVRIHYANSLNDNIRYDALQVQLFSTQLAEGDVAIDIGSHAGQYLLIMAARCGRTGKVVGFEPDPWARQALEKNIDLNPSLKRPKVESVALSDRNGQAVLYSTGGNSNSSLVRSGIGEEASKNSEQIIVTLMRLDDYLANNEIPTPRWVKIDTEGAEIRILQGAPNLLSSDAGIVCELHPYAWAEFGNTAAELKELAKSSGRRIRYLDQQEDIGDNPKYGTVILERIP